jgi:IMP dehydrogenase
VEEKYTFDDIILKPRYSTLRSRSEADTSVSFLGTELKNPIISANMESVTHAGMAIAMWKHGGIGALHRFCTIQENVEMYQEVVDAGAECMVSVGVKDECKDRAKALFEAGADTFIVDIAHGHSVLMEETVKWLREEFKDNVLIIGGNVATGLGAKELIHWGVDAVKCGVGPGSVCTTRMVTGHGMPQVSAIKDCAYWTRQLGVQLIADGGIRSSGDIIKALVFGADAVMIGGLFAGTNESAAQSYDGKKLYTGSAHNPRNSGAASEGISTVIESTGALELMMHELVGGIRSGMSYSDARTLDELRLNAQVCHQTSNGVTEGMPHMML